MEMMLEYDPAADAAYVELSDRAVDHTGELDEDRMVDYDADGGVVGYEFLNVSRGVELRDLPHREQLPPLFEGRNIHVLVQAGRATLNSASSRWTLHSSS